MRQIVTADIGGTHARFAIAMLDNGRVAEVGTPIVLRTNDYSSFEAAWDEFGRRCSVELPRDLAIAFAGPVRDDNPRLINSSWAVLPVQLRRTLGLDAVNIINDFGAVAHAVAALDANSFAHLCGPGGPLASEGVITVIGPGTGLGVALLHRRADSSYEVIETEGGHIGFAPADGVEDSMLAELRAKFGRVSAERVVSGPGLLNIYEALGAAEQRPSAQRIDRELWTAALTGADSLAVAALERFCLCLGAVAGDLALAHGASAVVIGGGIGQRLSDYLPSSGFSDRFTAKGRFKQQMAQTPVQLITHPEPGLFGAAAAFARVS